MKFAQPKQSNSQSRNTILLYGIPAIIFILLAVTVSLGYSTSYDSQILRLIHTEATPTLNQVFIFITTAGGVTATFVWMAVTLAILFKHHRFKQAYVLLAAISGAAILNTVIKLLFHRVRPELWQRIVTEHGLSFPSGHAMMSSALALSIVLLTWRTRWWRLAIGLGISYTLLVSYSRLYLGVHYPSDILAGWCVSIIWVCLVEQFTQGLKPTSKNEPISRVK